MFNIGSAYRALGKDKAAEDAFAEAQQQAEACGNLYVACLATRFQAVVARKHGRLRQAATLCREALRSFAGSAGPGERLFPALGIVYITLGEILLEWNELEEADHTLVKGLELNALTPEWHFQMFGYFALSRVKQALGNPAESSSILERARVLSSGAAPWVASFRVARQLAQADDDPNRLAAVARRLHEMQIDVESTAFHRRRSAYDDKLVLVRLLIAQRRAQSSAVGRLTRSPIDLQPVLRFLDAQQQLAKEGDRVEWTIRISVLQALAQQALGDIPGALDALKHALILAEPGGYVRVFVDEGAPMAALLRQARKPWQKAMPGYVDKLLAAFDEAASSGPTHPGTLLIEPLTLREIEVLQLVVAGDSNAQIAQQLFITVNTVKRHITHILGKLGVDNRTQAAVCARTLGLVD
jgi:LuxR family maltose regulon positive regulatory protein